MDAETVWGLTCFIVFLIAMFAAFRLSRSSDREMREDTEKTIRVMNQAKVKISSLKFRLRERKRRCVAAIDTLRGTRSLLKSAEQRLERLEASERAAKESEKAARDELKWLKDGLYKLLNHPEPSLADSVLEDCKKRATPDLKQFNVWRDPISLDYSEGSNGTDKFPVVDVPSENGEADDWRKRFPIGSRWNTRGAGTVVIDEHDVADPKRPLSGKTEHGPMWYQANGITLGYPRFDIIGPADDVEAPF